MIPASLHNCLGAVSQWCFSKMNVSASFISWLPLSFPQLPELYSSVKDLNKERKQAHHSNLCSLSLEEAQKHLMKNVDAMFFTGRPAVRQEDSLPVPEQSEVQNVEPTSIADLLHHSLLMDSISPLEQLSRSQQRLASGGIPRPVHIFCTVLWLRRPALLQWLTLRR